MPIICSSCITVKVQQIDLLRYQVENQTRTRSTKLQNYDKHD